MSDKNEAQQKTAWRIARKLWADVGAPVADTLANRSLFMVGYDAGRGSLRAENNKLRAALVRIREMSFIGGRDVAAEIAKKALEGKE